MDAETPDAGATELTHIDEGGAARMVDVGAKPVTRRTAEARGRVRMRPETLDLVRRNAMVKGDVLGVARLAGIMAAKRTDELIPLCHSLPLSGVDIAIEFDDGLPGVRVIGVCSTIAQTGVEMEALTAVAIACLTIYDMCKAVDRGLHIEDVHLTRKTGGRSGSFEQQ